VTAIRGVLARLRDDRGVAATAIVLFPIFAAVVFMFVQGAFWQLDVQAARAAADKASEAAAMYGYSSGSAESVARHQMASAGIRDISVTVSQGAAFTVVDVSGIAPGLLPGLSIRVSAHSVTPSERFDR
jgi:hypothetical protein